MKKLVLLALVLSAINTAPAAEVATDTFGTGANQFEIDFVTISGSTNPSSGYGIVSNDYRIGMYEITYDQWDKFQASYGPVTGSPSTAYDKTSRNDYFDRNIPASNISWYEAAQFVNYLNVSTGNPEAYKFTGTQGTGDYTMTVWDVIDTGYDPDNPYRNSNAKYFLPTEDEWVKAAYWNGTSLQEYATKPGESLIHGSISYPVGWNYYDSGSMFPSREPWDVGSGSEELNGTYDMMGNVGEWMESPHDGQTYLSASDRIVRGGSSFANVDFLGSSSRFPGSPDSEYSDIGFRVASNVPEPCCLVLLGLGGLILRNRKR